MTSGVFVWSIEQTLLASIAFGTVTAWQALASATSANADFWITITLLFSCLVALVMQSGIAFYSVTNVISQPVYDSKVTSDISYLHTAVAQAHCCIIVLLTCSYVFIFLTSLHDLVWVTAFFPSAPGLLFATGSGILSFCCILFFVSVANVWACTCVGNSNALFCYHPLFMMLCVVYPILHEIGQNGLIICSTPVITTLTFMYVNLTIASSFALHFMTIYEFDPAHVFPQFMHGVAGKRPFFCIYSLLHGLLIIVPFLCYAATSSSFSLYIAVVIALLAFVATLMQSVNFTQLFYKQKSIDNGVSDDLKRDFKIEDSDNPKVKSLENLKWLSNSRDSGQQISEIQSKDAKQLRIDFMRISKNDKNAIRKRG